MGYKYFMNNPCGARVGDCAVRAISKALNISWEEAYSKLAINGYRMCDMPSSNTVIASVLRQNGFYRENLPDYGDRPYTVREFAERNPIGVYVLGTGNPCRYVDDYREDKESPIKQNHIPVIVNDVWYPSKESASRSLGISSYLITRYLNGKRHDTQYVCKYGNQQPSQTKSDNSSLEGSTTNE